MNEDEALDAPVYSMRNGRIWEASLLLLARCEQCGGDAVYVHWPVGWTQTGGSRWNETYQEDGIAWWCPRCTNLGGSK